MLYLQPVGSEIIPLLSCDYKTHFAVLGILLVLSLCVHARTRVHNLSNSYLASIRKIKLLHISCVIQCSEACSRHMREQFVRKTVENLVVCRKMLISVFSKYSVRF
jgi:hypothetical protein